MNAALTTILGYAVVLVAVVGVLRGIDVRLVMFVGALALAGLAGDVTVVFKTFFSTLADEQYVVPICTAMGFAYVLRQSGCDRNLVLLLVKPVRRLRFLLLPASVGVGFLVNIAVISQASTAVAVGTVLIPLLRSAGLRPAVVGATLLLGASIGGELLNPGAPELQSVRKQLGPDSPEMQPELWPLLLVQLCVATVVFWVICGREERDEPEPIPRGEKINVAKALVPLVPLALLFTAGWPLRWLPIPEHWLIDANKPGVFSTRLIGLSMLVGCLATFVVEPKIWRTLAKSFFEGAGYALTNIVSVIVTANCFGAGIRGLKLADWVGTVTKDRRNLVWPLAGGLSILFAMVCGSGMATTESLYRFFVQPDWPDEGNLKIGAVVSIAAAAGRTSSPAAAVVLLCATLLDVKPIELLRRVVLPLVTATVVMVGFAWLRG